MQNIGYIIDKLLRSPIYNLVIHWISCRPFEQPGLVLFWWHPARRPVECVPCPRKHESGFVVCESQYAIRSTTAVSQICYFSPDLCTCIYAALNLE